MFEHLLYRSGRRLVSAYARLMLQIDSEWQAPLPDGPKLFVLNHPSTVDPFFVPLLASEQVSILIHGTLFKVPAFGYYLRLAGHIPVRPAHGREAFDTAVRLIEDGRTAAIFPEGAISPLDGGFHKPRSGAARLALRTGVPVIPVGIALDRRRLRLVETRVDGKGEVGVWYLHGPYAITVGEALRYTGDVEDRELVATASEQIMHRIADLAHQSTYRIEGMNVPQFRMTQALLDAASATQFDSGPAL
jgi:1-acyl-sn-glycerol-3-phosphate acyltransferase